METHHPRPSQRLEILAHLKAGHSLTQQQARKRFGAGRLGARIDNLRKEGHPIETEMVKVKTRRGTARVARYRYVAPQEEVK